MSTEAKFGLVSKKDLRDNEANKTALLAKLKDITGVDYTFEITPSFEELIPKVAKAGVYPRDYEKLGEIFYGKGGYLDFIVQKFEQACKDDMIKEALVEAISAKKILFTVRDAYVNAPNMQFKDGIFHVGCAAERFNSNKLYVCEGDITKLL